MTMSWRLELIREFRALLPKAPPTVEDVINAGYIFGAILVKVREAVTAHGGDLELPPEVDTDPVAFFARPEFQPLREAAALFEQYWQANIPAREIILSLAPDRAAADQDWIARDLARGDGYFRCAHELATAQPEARPALVQQWTDIFAKNARVYRDNLASPIIREAAAPVTVNAVHAA
jgi:hypothetical protein